MLLSNFRAKKELGVVFTVLLVLVILFNAVNYFVQTHFLWKTKIDNIPCSFLSLEEAIEKVNLEKGEEILTFCFSNGKTYNVESKKLGIRIEESRVTEIFDKQHSNHKEAREYNLNGFILADAEMLREFLKLIPELQEENMVEPENAYIILNETEFCIQEEELGNIIVFEKTINFALEKIKNGEREIDFSSITGKSPEISKEDLVDERDELNAILKSTINFVLSDGSIVNLDSKIIRNWIQQDENGKFTIDVENGVAEFVEELALKVNEANSKLKFVATDSNGLAEVNVPMDVRAQLDKEKQIAKIKSLLGNSEPVYKRPIYDKELISDMLSSYIEIDISRQHIWFYKDGKLIVDTPCVTGNVKDGYSTPTGVFFLKNKNRKVNLEGFNKDGSKYSSFVEYWMRFNQGIGMHDASWRVKFGGSIYQKNGSHGCVNMPPDAAAQTYENIDETMPIIVYQSKT